MKKIQVVLPVYNEVEVIGDFNQELFKVIESLADRYTFGADYALTLRAWLARFEQALPQVRHHSFDDGFIRLWQFYLYYCIAAFEAGRTDVCQLEIQRRA